MKDKNIGEFIRSQRKAQKLTAEELAKRIGVDRTYISKIEKHNYLPSYSVLAKIAKTLKSNEILERYMSKKYPEMLKDISGMKKISKI